MKNRPKGLKYNIKVENKAWIKKGERLSPRSEFKKGMTPWNKGTKGVVKKNSGSFLKGTTENENNVNWMGDNVGYDALHAWIYRKYGKPVICDFCGGNRNVQWASKDYSYKRLRESWIKLCKKCHTRYDMDNGWGVATKKFNLNRSKLWQKR